MRRWAALLVALGALAEIGAQALVAWRVPSDDEWRTAAAHVRRSFQASDGIVFAPDWVDPIGRAHLGDLVTVDEAARPDRSRQGRIWEVSIRGAEHSEARGRVAETRIFGRVRVRRIERRAARVLFDFSSALAERSRVAEIGFSPYRCIRANPPDTIDFQDVPIGRSLRLGGGIHDFQSRYRSSVPVTLEVLLDGKRIAKERFTNDGWRRVTIDTASSAERRATVRFQVSARKTAARTFCFHAEVHR